MIGTAIEWYDFFVYGTSAVLVLGPLVFGTDDPLTATLLAFSTFGVGFLARPIGAVVNSAAQTTGGHIKGQCAMRASTRKRPHHT